MLVRGVFVDANGSLADIFERQNKAGDPAVHVNRNADIKSDDMPALLDGAEIVVIDHTSLPTDVAKRCNGLKHVVFLGTGARSYMNPEELAELGIEVHLIKGYGDTAVAECAIALMWAAARGIAKMDREMRAGNWLREDGMQLTGKTLGLIGFGGIAAEVARIALGSGMKVIAWNRSPKQFAGVEFVSLEALLAQSDVVSLHLLLNDETRGFLSRERIDAMKPGVILVNTARARHGRRGRDDRGAEVGPHPPRRARCVQHRAAAGRSSADQNPERDAVGAFGVSHAGSERKSDPRGVGALPKDCEGRIEPQRTFTLSPCGRRWREEAIAKFEPGEGLRSIETTNPSPGLSLTLETSPSPTRGEGRALYSTISATALPHAVVSPLPPRSRVRRVRSPSVRSIAPRSHAAACF